MDGAQGCCHTAGIHLGAQLRGMRMVVIEVFRSTRLTLLLTRRVALLLKEIGRDIMYVCKGDTRLGNDLAIPLSVRVVTAFYLVAWPLIPRCQRQEDGGSSLLYRRRYQPKLYTSS